MDRKQTLALVFRIEIAVDIVVILVGLVLLLTNVSKVVAGIVICIGVVSLVVGVYLFGHLMKQAEQAEEAPEDDNP